MPTINWSNVTDMSQLPAQANVATGGSFWIGMLYMIFVILLIILSSFGFEVALMTSSFLALILSLLLVYAGLVSWTSTTLVFLGIILTMIVYVLWSNPKYRE